jgi:hypothetical protein
MEGDRAVHRRRQLLAVEQLVQRPR